MKKLQAVRFIVDKRTGNVPLDLCHIIGLRPPFSALRASTRPSALISILEKVKFSQTDDPSAISDLAYSTATYDTGLHAKFQP